jgi:hypothetical protein
MSETTQLIAKLRGMQVGWGFDPLVQQLADVIDTLDKRVAVIEKENLDKRLTILEKPNQASATTVVG